jgi:Spy/CpxP family protein refolding chaperone
VNDKPKGTHMRITRTGLVSGAALLCAAAVAVTGASIATAHDAGGKKSMSASGSFERHGAKGAPLANLVASGTITQAQADAIKAALDAQRTTNMAAHDKAEAAALAALVAKGTITQAQADAITTAGRGGVRDLVAKGTITQAQAQAIRTAMQDLHSAGMGAGSKFNDVLAGLVTKGTISQAQADAIKANLGARGMGKGIGHSMGKQGAGHGMRGGSGSTPAATSSMLS